MILVDILEKAPDRGLKKWQSIGLERVTNLRTRWFGLLGFLLALFLVAGPLAGDLLAASDVSSDPHAGHDMSTMNDSGQSNGDMHDTNVQGANAHDNPGVGNQHEGTSTGGHGSSETELDNSSNEGHDSGSGGHGESKGDPSAPPNWPVIYGFGAFNLLVIIIAALLKNKSVSVRDGVN